MARKTGYLANILNFPPLVFRFQYNPDLISEKKSFKYTPATAFGKWDIPATAAGAAGVKAASGVLATAGALASMAKGAYDDVKGISALLVATKPLEADEGEQRTFAIDFQLDGDNPGPLDGEGSDAHFNHSIEPDLALLRSFMNPAFDVIDVGKAIAAVAGRGKVPCWKRPPEVTLYYAGLSPTCVMTDLNIKMTRFYDDGKPARAEVSVTLKEQTNSIAPTVEWFVRQYQVFRSYGRNGFWSDVAASTPIVNLFT